MITHLLAALLFAVALGYELAFTQTTRRLAAQISSVENQRRVQDALTPPKTNLVGCVTYILICGAVSAGWYRFGWVSGLLTAVGMLIVAGVTSSALLDHGFAWLKGTIIRSMINRYADFVRDGDVMRATAVSEFLNRLGYPVPSVRLGGASVRLYGSLPAVQWLIVLVGLIAAVFTIATGWDEMTAILSGLASR